PDLRAQLRLVKHGACLLAVNPSGGQWRQKSKIASCISDRNVRYARQAALPTCHFGDYRLLPFIRATETTVVAKRSLLETFVSVRRVTSRSISVGTPNRDGSRCPTWRLPDFGNSWIYLTLGALTNSRSATGRNNASNPEAFPHEM